MSNELLKPIETDHECDDSECDNCNPVVEVDCDICSACKEHSQFRENTGSECCGAGAWF